MDEPVEPSTPAPQVTQPIIVDLGRQKGKNVKALKKGEGKLWEDVQTVVEKVQDELGESAAGKVFVPVVIIYQKKLKRQRLQKLIFPNL